MGLVSAGVGVTFVPASIQRLRFDNVVYKPLHEQNMLSETNLAWTHPHPSALLKAFVETPRQIAQVEFSG